VPVTEISFSYGEVPKLFHTLVFAPLWCWTPYTSGRADCVLRYPLKCNIIYSRSW